MKNRSELARNSLRIQTKLSRAWTGSPFEQSEHLPGQISLKIATNPMSIVKKSKIDFFLKKKNPSLLSADAGIYINFPYSPYSPFKGEPLLS